MKDQPSSSDLNRSKQHIENVLKEITSKIVAPTKTPRDLMVERANEVTRRCQQHFRTQHRINVVPMRKDDAVEHIYKLYQDELVTWSKDELLMLTCLTLSVLAVESLHDELI